MPASDSTTAALEVLRGVYADADALFSGWACPSSTECCRFGVTGREPYVTSIERLALEHAIAARGGPRSWKRAPATSRVALPIVRDERRCPLLDAAGKCAVYAARPLGCRTFFCDRAFGGAKVRQREINDLVRRIRDIAAGHEPSGDQGRLLTRVLVL
jgi:Fe-S-cluster containining protein